MVKISILMCVYNGEAHLREAVESILEQTFKDLMNMSSKLFAILV